MPTAADTVTAFLAQCGKGKAEMMDAFRSYFTPETVWEMVGSASTTGPGEALELMKSVQSEYGMECMFVEILTMATQGDKVLTERIDNVRDANGNNLMSVPTMGIFEVDGGKITAWRDYYDTATYGN